MNKKLSGIFWGIVLVAGGIYGLAQTLGYEAPQDPRVWMFIFGAISLFALVFYLIDGLKQWGWLFPVGIFGALALMMLFVDQGADNPAMAAPLFIAIGFPFAVAFFLDRKENWWALISMGVFAFLTLFVLVVDNAPGVWVGTALFWVLAVIFFLIFLSRRAMWAALVAYIMFVLGLTPLLGTSSRPELAGVVLFFAIGLPFLFVYLRNSERWWALIPAGILLTMGVVTALVFLPGIPTDAYENKVSNAIIYAGIAGTFAILWLRHHLRWAMVVAALGAVMAAASLFMKDLQVVWAVAVILAGGLLIYRALSRANENE
jgi:hypothetical protein